jgi:hypothetical protein
MFTTQWPPAVDKTQRREAIEVYNLMASGTAIELYKSMDADGY